MFSRHLAYEIGRDLRRVRERFPEHARELRNHRLRLLLADIQLRVVCAEVPCDFRGSRRFVIGVFIHADCERPDFPGRQRLHD